MSNRITRRRFLESSIAASGALAGVGYWTSRSLAATRSPNEKLNIALIGTAHRAEANIDGVRGENIVAACDIDDRLLDRAIQRFPKAHRYNDFRKLLEQKEIDAVVVSTADHVHAPASVGAMKLGKHVYCEKPLTHSVYEARVVAQTAKEQKVATQMGTQIHAENNYRRVVEAIQVGSIGPVHEVHVWCGKSWSGGERPTETPPTPPYLHWDLWLGPAPERPYHPTYQPANWRRWWDFGGGTLGDMGCHYMDLPFWALKLRHPTSAETIGPPVHPETAPDWKVATWEFPSRDDMPGLTFTWTDGSRRPEAFEKYKLPKWGDGVLFVGSKAMLIADYDQYRLLPEDQFKDFKRPPESIPNSVGHYNEWITACKTGSETTCNFDYSGALTETVLLGNVAFRAGKKLQWDAEKLYAPNCPEAERLIRREYRKGWTL